MDKIYHQSRLKYVNLAIIFLLSYLLNCAYQNKLIFLDSVIKQNICEVILKHSFWILCVLVLWYLLNYYLLEIRSRENIAAVVYDNICHEIFNRFVKTKPISHNLMKVSLLKAFNQESERPYLKVVGRYQTKRPKRKSRIKFGVGEGCAGIAYETGYCVQKSIAEFDPRSVSKYYEESEKVFKLKQDKARQLNDKACDFLCIPVKYFGEDEPWGVLSLDSMKKDTLSSQEEAREIEKVLTCFSVFLMLE